MKKLLLLYSIIIFSSCAFQYAVKNEVDSYTGFNNIYETNNRVQGMTGSVYLNLSKSSKNGEDIVFIRYDYRDSDWIFMEQKDGIQLLLSNGEVVKLSSLDFPIGMLKVVEVM